MTDRARHRSSRPFGIAAWAEPYRARARLILGTSTAEPIRLSELGRLAGFDPESLLADDRPLGHGPIGGSFELREAIALWTGGVSRDDVAVTGGAGEALFALAWSLGDSPHVVVEVPVHQSVFAALEQRRCRISEVTMPTGAEAVLEAIGPETAAAFLVSPHNPSGHVWERAELEAIACKLASNDGLLVVDEAFWGVGVGKAVQPRAASLATNAVSVGSVSKVHGLPGVRIGWAAGSTLAIDDVRSLHTEVVRSRPLLTEQLALYALRAQRALFARTQGMIDRSLPLVTAAFERHPESIQLPEPDGGNVGLARMPGVDVEGWCRRLAEQHGVLLAPGGACFGLPGTFSLNLALQSSAWEEAIPILDDALVALPPADSLSLG
jgi:aspartate/methionine/tyrosine aminotransferase